MTVEGWRDELKEHCKEVIRKKGLEKVTVEELVAEITPHGRCKGFYSINVVIILTFKNCSTLQQPLFQKKSKQSYSREFVSSFRQPSFILWLHAQFIAISFPSSFSSRNHSAGV